MVCTNDAIKKTSDLHQQVISHRVHLDDEPPTSGKKGTGSETRKPEVIALDPLGWLCFDEHFQQDLKHNKAPHKYYTEG